VSFALSVKSIAASPHPSLGIAPAISSSQSVITIIHSFTNPPLPFQTIHQNPSPPAKLDPSFSVQPPRSLSVLCQETEMKLERKKKERKMKAEEKKKKPRKEKRCSTV
jgi:hypothetical protein